MKKIVSLFLVLALALCFAGCETMCYTNVPERIGDFYGGVNKLAGSCFVGIYDPEDFDAECREIVIPDEYEGLPITRLGGYTGRGLGCPFTFSCYQTEKNNVYIEDPSTYSFDFEYEIKEVVYTLYMGKNLTKIVDVEMDRYYLLEENGAFVFYRPCVYIVCDEENPAFYSKDGKLYDKKTDELITEFVYGEQE